MPTLNSFSVLFALTPAVRALEQAAGKSSPTEFEAGGHGRRSKYKGPPRIEKRAAKGGECSAFHVFKDNILGLLQRFKAGMPTDSLYSLVIIENEMANLERERC